MYDLVIQNGYIVDPKNDREGCLSLALEGGRIAEVSDKPMQAKAFFDAGGLHVMPGMIDMHVHVTSLFAGNYGIPMIAQSGVTSAIDFSGPISEIKKVLADKGSGINIGCCEAIIPGMTVDTDDLSREDLEKFIERSLENGALGIKLLGGHFPLTSEATEAAIDVANMKKAFIACHSGTKANGSNIEGFKETIELAGKNPLFIAHINAYCRGLVKKPLLEIQEALDCLETHPNIRSESHMAHINGTSAIIEGGNPKSHVTRNCLKMAGYEDTEEGLRQAILDGYGLIHISDETSIRLASGDEAICYWEGKGTKTGISFPVNRRDTAFLCASAKSANGSFSIDALSTDGGGIPRNNLLQMGLCLVKFGALSLREFVHKTSTRPAELLGLKSKGNLSPGCDADITIFDYEKQRAIHSLVDGAFVLRDEQLVGQKGKIITTSYGETSLKEDRIPRIVIDSKALYGR
ncbi:MAG: amidohydrolase family protein [Deltaproteobacteria bacterium]|nr:amidohydrolase family protein [Deltaproteobacteria bacterium]